MNHVDKLKKKIVVARSEKTVHIKVSAYRNKIK